MEEINQLNCPLMSTDQIRSLREKQIITLSDLISAPPDLVMTSMGVSEWVCQVGNGIHSIRKDYKKIKQSTVRYLQPLPQSLCQIAVNQDMTSMSTGISSFDKLLGGGLFPGDLIELYGKTGSGKSQMCMYLTSQVSRWKGGNATVIYFDLKNDFYCKRLLDLCGGDDTGLENVIIFSVANLERLMAKLDDIRQELVGGVNGIYSRCRLLVVDSVPMVIYPAVERDHYSWRYHQERLMEKLEWLANYMKLTVILVNHAVTPRTLTTSSSAPMIKAALGSYWQHRIQLRIQLSKLTVVSNSSVYYSGFLEKSSRGPCGGSFYFSITTDAINEICVKPGTKKT